jgi:DNA polymerase-3 subunit delta'
VSDETALPEPDRVPGAPHPRETPRTFGHAAPQAAILDAFAADRLHHAWLLNGPRGVGKATLAWAIARFLLTAPETSGGGLFGDPPPPPASLEATPDHPVLRRMLALAEPRLFLLRRTANDRGDRLSQDIRVEDVRRLISFLRLSAADGGRRVVIVDCADEMNPSAANALLKLLEDPPARVTFLLVSHQPSSLLPTIRSRCRDLRLGPLSPDDLAAALAQAGVAAPDGLAALSGGSAGDAVRLALLDGPEVYAAFCALFATLPRLDRARAAALADSAVARGAEARTDLAFTLLPAFLARLARRGTLGTDLPEAAAGEAALLARLAPSPRAARVWADLQAELSARIRHGRDVNLDPAALLLDMVVKIAETAGRLA